MSELLRKIRHSTFKFRLLLFVPDFPMGEIATKATFKPEFRTYVTNDAVWTNSKGLYQWTFTRNYPALHYTLSKLVVLRLS